MADRDPASTVRHPWQEIGFNTPAIQQHFGLSDAVRRLHGRHRGRARRCTLSCRVGAPALAAEAPSGSGPGEDRLQHAGHSGALRADRRRRRLPGRHRGGAGRCHRVAGRLGRAGRRGRGGGPGRGRRRGRRAGAGPGAGGPRHLLRRHRAGPGRQHLPPRRDLRRRGPGRGPLGHGGHGDQGGRRRGRRGAGGGPGGDGAVRPVVPRRPRGGARSRATGSSPGRWWPRSPWLPATSSASRSGRSGHLSVRFAD